MMGLRVFALILLIGLSVACNATEKILNFHSDITINKDTSLDVVETITVQAEGKQIKRGINQRSIWAI